MFRVFANTALGPVLEGKNGILTLETILKTAVAGRIAKTNAGTGLTGSHLGNPCVVPEAKGIGLLLGAGLTKDVVDVVKVPVGYGSLGTDNGGLGTVVTTAKETTLVLEARLTHGVRSGVTHTDGGTGLFGNHGANSSIISFSGLSEA